MGKQAHMIPIVGSTPVQIMGSEMSPGWQLEIVQEIVESVLTREIRITLFKRHKINAHYTSSACAEQERLLSNRQSGEIGEMENLQRSDRKNHNDLQFPSQRHLESRQCEDWNNDQSHVGNCVENTHRDLHR